MSTTANLDVFDEDEPSIDIRVKEVDLSTVPKDSLETLLHHKRIESRNRSIKKLLLAVITQIPFILTLLRGFL